jgi:hypothetical protein
MQRWMLPGFAAMLCLTAGAVRAQDRPFVFSVTTGAGSSDARVALSYDVGLGDSTFRSVQPAGPEHQVGLQASLGRWTLIGRVGTTPTGASYTASQQGEILFSVLTPASHGVSLALGGGILRESSGTNVALARVVAGREFGQWRLHGNLVFQKAMTSGRDPVDLVTTLGWARQFGSSVWLGVEGIAEDLEGFWDPAETEGGARLLVGPSVHIAPRGRRWQITLAGGPMFHPSDTGRSSLALRNLPPGSASRGYAARTSFSYTF